MEHLTRDVLTRGVPEEDYASIRMLAAAIGVSGNTLRKWALSELASPYSEFRKAMLERAEEVEMQKNRRLKVYNVPSPQQRTRPMNSGL